MTGNLTQEQVWDKIAESWEKFRKKQPIKEIAEFLKEQDKENTSKSRRKILDLGCGSGRHFLKLKNTEIYGVDSSENMIELAGKSAKIKGIKVKLKKASAEKLLFKDNFFDSAIFAATLHCIEPEEKRRKSLRELKRVLKRGGKAIISVWSRKQERVKNKPKETFVPWTINGVKYLRKYYLYDKKELVKLLKDTGFVIVKAWENENICVIVKKE